MKRIQKLKKIRDTILIITNGKQTEKNYLNSITTHFKSMFTIKVEYKNYECDKLVEYAISKKAGNFNQIWCLFDIDESYKDGHLLIALQNAKKIYQKLEANHLKKYYGNTNYPIWDWKSSTTVFELIDTLKLTKRQDD